MRYTFSFLFGKRLKVSLLYDSEDTLRFNKKLF